MTDFHNVKPGKRPTLKEILSRVNLQAPIGEGIGPSNWSLWSDTHIDAIRERDKPAIIMMPHNPEIGIDGMKLELRALDPEHKAHGEVRDLKWRV